MSECRKATREWVRKARAPNYDAPPLPTASEASGNELPPYLPPEKVSLIFMKIYRNEV